MKKLLLSLLLLAVVSNVCAQRSNVEVIYGYLYVFPAELGVFETTPSRVIEQLNSNFQYGYNSWRLPNDEELALLKANGYARYDAIYMTNSNNNSKGIVLLVTTKEEIESANRRQAEQDFMSSVSIIKSQTGYIDLGLPSGTKWAAQNYGGENKKYKLSQVCTSCLPSKSQWGELERECTWTWVSSQKGFIIKGKNGNAIFLGATRGFIDFNGTTLCARSGNGMYWSSSFEYERRGYFLYYYFVFEDGNTNPENFMHETPEGSYLCVRYVQ